MRYLYIFLFSIALAADDHSSEGKIDENCKDITKDNISERSFSSEKLHSLKFFKFNLFKFFSKRLLINLLMFFKCFTKILVKLFVV